jgi:hypothetical protein
MSRQDLIRETISVVPIIGMRRQSSTDARPNAQTSVSGTDGIDNAQERSFAWRET